MAIQIRGGTLVRVGFGAGLLGLVYLAIQRVDSGTLWGVVLAVIGFALVIVLFGAFNRWRERSRKLEFGGRLHRGLSELFRPASNAELTEKEIAEQDDLRRKLDEGFAKIRQGGVDLRDHPLLVIVGESGGGKTELVRRSGISFAEGLHDPRQGAGGTKGMDIWFADDGLIVDTAGKATVREKPGADSGSASAGGRPGGEGQQPSGSSAPWDNPQWKAILKYLRSCRPKCPVNSIVVAIPMRSLLEDSDEEIRRKAGDLARSLHLLQDETGVRCPVNVVITMSDLVPGYREFVEHLRDKAIQHQILGWSNPDRIDDQQSEFRASQIPQHLESVAQAFEGRRNAILRAQVVVPDGRRRFDAMDALYTFPSDIRSLAQPLQGYLEVLFSTKKNRYVSRKPLFMRGLYFASSMQQGAALDRSLAKFLGMPVRAVAEEDEERDGPVLHERSHGMRDLFEKKIFPETGLVTQAPHVAKMLRLRNGAVIGAGACAGLLILGMGWAWWDEIGQQVSNRAQAFDTLDSGTSALFVAPAGEELTVLPPLAAPRDILRTALDGQAIEDGSSRKPAPSIAQALVDLVGPTAVQPGSSAPEATRGAAAEEPRPWNGAVAWPPGSGGSDSFLLQAVSGLLPGPGISQSEMQQKWRAVCRAFVLHPAMAAAAIELQRRPEAALDGEEARHALVLLLEANSRANDELKDKPWVTPRRVEHREGTQDGSRGPDVAALRRFVLPPDRTAPDEAPQGSGAAQTSPAARHLSDAITAGIAEGSAENEPRHWVGDPMFKADGRLDALFGSLTNLLQSRMKSPPDARVAYDTLAAITRDVVEDAARDCSGTKHATISSAVKKIATLRVPEPGQGLQSAVRSQVDGFEQQWRSLCTSAAEADVVMRQPGESEAEGDSSETDPAQSRRRDWPRMQDQASAAAKDFRVAGGAPNLWLEGLWSKDAESLRDIERINNALAATREGTPIPPAAPCDRFGWLAARRVALDSWRNGAMSTVDGALGSLAASENLKGLHEALRNCLHDKAKKEEVTAVAEFVAWLEQARLTAVSEIESHAARASAELGPATPSLVRDVPVSPATMPHWQWPSYDPRVASAMLADLAIASDHATATGHAIEALTSYRKKFQQHWCGSADSRRVTHAWHDGAPSAVPSSPLDSVKAVLGDQDERGAARAVVGAVKFWHELRNECKCATKQDSPTWTDAYIDAGRTEQLQKVLKTWGEIAKILGDSVEGDLDASGCERILNVAGPFMYNPPDGAAQHDEALEFDSYCQALTRAWTAALEARVPERPVDQGDAMKCPCVLATGCEWLPYAVVREVIEGGGGGGASGAGSQRPSNEEQRARERLRTYAESARPVSPACRARLQSLARIKIKAVRFASAGCISGRGYPDQERFFKEEEVLEFNWANGETTTMKFMLAKGLDPIDKGSWPPELGLLDVASVSVSMNNVKDFNVPQPLRWPVEGDWLLLRALQGASVKDNKYTISLPIQVMGGKEAMPKDWAKLEVELSEALPLDKSGK